MVSNFLAFLATLCLISFSAATGCKGSAKYGVIFKNLLTNDSFGDLPGFPSTGLVFSPLAGVSHSNRQSFFTIRGFASKAVEQIAETGNNSEFISLAETLRKEGQGVLSIVDVGAPTQPGEATSLILKVDCEHPFLTVLGMIAPSPDWIVQINNRNTFDESTGKFVNSTSGNLIAYDAGVDDGREFTPPLALDLDLPTVPQKNIAPLVEDETDRFDGRVVGKWIIKKISEAES